MENQERTKLSSNGTKLFSYILLGTYLFISLMIGFATIKEYQGFHGGMIISILGFLLLTFLVFYQFLFTCKAQIIGDQIVLKKIFRAPKTYEFNRLRYPSAFRLKNMNYINLKMRNDDGSYERYLILNSRSIFSTNKQAEVILKNIYSSKKDEIIKIERALRT